MELEFEVQGLKELERNLLALSAEYGPKTGPQAMRPAIKAAVGEIEGTISHFTPRDTGKLADSTKIRIGKPTRAMLRSEHFNQDTIIAARIGWTWSGASLWNQALNVEFGTSKSSGQAILRTSFDLHRDQMLKDFADTLGPAIEKKAKALHRKRAKSRSV